MTALSSDTNVNLSEAELARLYEARKWAWIKRKFIRTRRYRRQYARRAAAHGGAACSR